MNYEMILKDGTILKCWTEDVKGIIQMMVEDHMFVVQESENLKLTTYILPSKVSHFRFMKEKGGIVEPR